MQIKKNKQKGTKKNAYMQIKKNKQKVYIYVVYI